MADTKNKTTSYTFNFAIGLDGLGEEISSETSNALEEWHKNVASSLPVKLRDDLKDTFTVNVVDFRIQNHSKVAAEIHAEANSQVRIHPQSGEEYHTISSYQQLALNKKTLQKWVEDITLAIEHFLLNRESRLALDIDNLKEIKEIITSILGYTRQTDRFSTIDSDKYDKLDVFCVKNNKQHVSFPSYVSSDYLDGLLDGLVDESKSLNERIAAIYGRKVASLVEQRKVIAVDFFMNLARRDLKRINYHPVTDSYALDLGNYGVGLG